MPATLGRERLAWPAETWTTIDKVVLDEVGRIRIAQKVFPTSTQTDGQYVPDDTIDRTGGTLSIPEGRTKPYVELAVDFALTPSQVQNEGTLHTGQTLAIQAAKAIAQAEDLAYFQGARGLPQASGSVDELRVINREAAGPGLLNLPDIHVIAVQPREGAKGNGENTVKAVVAGISHLGAKLQPGPYALILASDVYADTLGFTRATSVDPLTPLLAGGFHGTGTLPARTGLLTSLGGQPTTLFIGQDAITAYTQEDADRRSQLCVFARVQIVARDTRAFVRLEFK